MSRHAGQSTVVFSTAFFSWFRWHIITMNDYAYAGVDFRGDPDLVLPEGAQWGAIGKNFLTMFLIFSKVYTIFLCFWWFLRTKLNVWCNANFGHIQPVEEPVQEENEPVERTVQRAVLQDLDMVETLSELQHHIDGLTFGIPDCWIEELPMWLQRHTIGVPNCWMRLLRRIARYIACYHEYH